MTTAVVVGSGPNGLAAAIRLAQAGVEVTVVEAHARPGGGTRTSELTLPGVLHDDCAAFHPTGVASPFFQSLGLERHGLRWLWPEVDLAHPLDDGRAGLAARDLSITNESLGVDAARWRRVFDAPIRGFDDLISEVFQPVVHLPSHPVTLARFGIRALMPATWTAGQFKDDPARALFMGVAAHSFSQLTTPLSSSVGLLLTAAAHAVGWPVAEGGTESITRALLAELAELGGTVVTDTRVQSLDGLADLVGSAPDVVMLDTAPAGVLEIVLLGQQYLIDPTRSVGTTNPVYAYAHVPHGYEGDATDAVIAQIERFAPGFHDRILAVSTRNPAGLEAYNPNYVGGDIAAGANTARQIAFRPRVTSNPYSLGVKGVYLCSSATPPGGGVHGMCGLYAANTALSRL